MAASWAGIDGWGGGAKASWWGDAAFSAHPVGERSLQLGLGGFGSDDVGLGLLLGPHCLRGR